MNIAHVIPSLAIRNGGPVIFVASLTRTLADLGHDVTIFTTDIATPAQALQTRAGIRADEMPAELASIDVRVYPIRSPHRVVYSPELQRELRRSLPDFDIVHVHSLNLHTQFAAWRGARRARTPYVVSPHGALDPFIRSRGRWQKQLIDLAWQRRMMRQAAALHGTTVLERRSIEEYGVRSPIRVIPIGVHTVEFAKPLPRFAFRDRFLDGFRGPLLFNHGRLTAKKGLDIAVRALAALRDHVPDAMLAIVGPDDEGIGAELRSTAAKIGIADAIFFIGQLSGDDLISALQDADIWLLPSHAENFGIAVVEALSAGLPVITTSEVFVAPEAAENGALIIVDNTPEAFAAAARFLFSNEYQIALLSESGRKYAVRFDWSTVATDFVSLYEEVVSRATAGSPA